MARWVGLAVLVAVVLAGGWLYQARTQPGPILRTVGDAYRLGDLTFTPVELRKRSFAFLPTYVGAEEGRLFAPLDHERPDGRTVELHMLRFPRASNDAQGWPIVVLVDGAADTALEFATGDRFAFIQALRAVGEVVVLDQRGSRYSEPFLECPGAYAFPMDEPSNLERRAATFAGYVRQCARGWAGINLGAFTPRDSAFDVEDVRVALGVERINLVGYGSGTRVAMDYLRLYPNRAEQAVLVGAAAPSQVDALPADGEAALDRIATAIATDVNVGPKFPDLRTALVLLLDEVERAPVSVAVTAGGQTQEVVLGANDVLGYLVYLLQDRDRIAVLPRELAAMQAGDFRTLAALTLPARTENGLASLAQVAFECTGNGRERAAKVAEQAPTALIGNYLNLARAAACPVLPPPILPASFRDPVLSDTPTLFVSGTWDIVTPPENVDEMLEGFLSAWQVSIDGATHGDLLTASASVAEIIVAFLRGDPPPADSVILPPVRFLSL